MTKCKNRVVNVWECENEKEEKKRRGRFYEEGSGSGSEEAG